MGQHMPEHPDMPPLRATQRFILYARCAVGRAAFDRARKLAESEGARVLSASQKHSCMLLEVGTERVLTLLHLLPGWRCIRETRVYLRRSTPGSQR
jgi:hypothetical protein